MTREPSLGVVGLATAVGLVAVNRAALACGVRRRVDGWRRAAGLVLRGPESTFVLSAFGLDAWSDAPEAAAGATRAALEAHVAARLELFLRGERELHVRVRRGEAEDRAEACAGMCWRLRFEGAPAGTARFVAPRAWGGVLRGCETEVVERGECAVVLEVVCRVEAGGDPGRVDVWVRANHVGTDGVPVQAMLTRLEGAWGVDGALRYPGGEACAEIERVRALEGPGVRADAGEVQAFVDFGPLLAWRKRENARLGTAMTVSAALLWHLGRHPAGAGRWLGTTVEVAEGRGCGRGVGVVVVRPADYERFGEAGLGRYVQDFNAQVERTRRRATAGCATLDAAAHVPAGLAAGLLRKALDDGKAFGAIGLTILKDARVFGAPLASRGHGEGFVAVGSVGLTSERGPVGCVCVKGDAGSVGGWPGVMREVVGRAG
jgi:hypothetical protein